MPEAPFQDRPSTRDCHLVSARERMVGPRAILALARPMLGRWVELHPLEPHTMHSDLLEAARSESIWTYLPYGPFVRAEEMRAWLEECAAQLDPVFFGVWSTTIRKWIGMCSFLHIELNQRRLEIGHIWFGHSYQRTEAQTEMSYLMLSRAFDEIECRRVEWVCDSRNTASRNAAKRMGLAEEGVMRQHALPKGINRDTVMHGMIDSQWKSARQGFERWLSLPGNERPPLRNMIDAVQNGQPYVPEMTSIVVREARREDLPQIVVMLADDDLGRQREVPSQPLDPLYTAAFERIRTNPHSKQIVVEVNGDVVATCQVTIIPSLTHSGATRCSIEGVRVASRQRSNGLGRTLIEWVIEYARRRNCRIVELATHHSRDRARRFYETLGFEATHFGMKQQLSPTP